MGSGDNEYWEGRKGCKPRQGNPRACCSSAGAAMYIQGCCCASTTVWVHATRRADTQGQSKGGVGPERPRLLTTVNAQKFTPMLKSKSEKLWATSVPRIMTWDPWIRVWVRCGTY
ncbi:hypothetical protein M406DRAFT_68463 [Cryphonectria parasitica EP155]|uniref:Uncharacterized protein n=1 Tax=Cryphonectria parasitica (strain ATCC 38755 / EP155) TaxID=660469 RepID=A0A9P5CP35_CRYP1|nr:uncharacterized protein M406DRAFT_68463 [Cryphonectria parasitica EP155]KAF3766084.1 hypothetical protein M406DRAFT_68463 [Cryphonectria parasitica EP155]